MASGRKIIKVGLGCKPGHLEYKFCWAYQGHVIHSLHHYEPTGKEVIDATQCSVLDLPPTENIGLNSARGISCRGLVKTLLQPHIDL
jgi:hypothetical protein